MLTLFLFFKLLIPINLKSSLVWNSTLISIILLIIKLQPLSSSRHSKSIFILFPFLMSKVIILKCWFLLCLFLHQHYYHHFHHITRCQEQALKFFQYFKWFCKSESVLPPYYSFISFCSSCNTVWFAKHISVEYLTPTSSQSPNFISPSLCSKFESRGCCVLGLIKDSLLACILSSTRWCNFTYTLLQIWTLLFKLFLLFFHLMLLSILETLFFHNL